MKAGTVAAAVAGLLALGIGLGAALVSQSGPASQRATALSPGGATTSAQDIVQQALAAGKPTVAEFGANACAACREMKPVLEALRRTHGERITVVNVDLIAQKETDYIRHYRIQLMPTQLFFDAQGRETGRHLGKISAEEILAQLQGGTQGGRP
jgi:thioredoxin 1